MSELNDEEWVLLHGTWDAELRFRLAEMRMVSYLAQGVALGLVGYVALEPPIDDERLVWAFLALLFADFVWMLYLLCRRAARR